MYTCTSYQLKPHSTGRESLTFFLLFFSSVFCLRVCRESRAGGDAVQPCFCPAGRGPRLPRQRPLSRFSRRRPRSWRMDFYARSSPARDDEVSERTPLCAPDPELSRFEASAQDGSGTGRDGDLVFGKVNDYNVAVQLRHSR